VKNILLKNFRLVDANIDEEGSIFVENGVIKEVFLGKNCPENASYGLIIDGLHLIPTGRAVLTPSFVDLHAHFRYPGFLEKESLESGSLAAVAGGYGTIVSMANTKPVVDSIDLAFALKKRSDALGLIDLYPFLSLTKNM
jgi:dihydroorotase